MTKPFGRVCNAGRDRRGQYSSADDKHQERERILRSVNSAMKSRLFSRLSPNSIPYIPAEEMRIGALMFIDWVAHRYDALGKDMCPSGVTLKFEPAGGFELLHGDGYSDMFSKIAKRSSIDNTTVEFSELVFSMLGHILSWCQDSSMHHNWMMAYREVLCPVTLDAKRRDLFGGYKGKPLRSVSVYEMKTLVKSLPIVLITQLAPNTTRESKAEWETSGGLIGWMTKWYCFTNSMPT